jgi:hypothetical protein
VYINDVAADVRAALVVKVNNSWRALISRELIARTPRLAILIQTRRRRAV